jgi:hypothetical protein
LSSPSLPHSRPPSDLSFIPASDPLCEAIERQVVRRTFGRVRHLRVERDGTRVIVTGLSPSYYIKQLTIEGAREVLHCPADGLTLDVRVHVGADCPD